MEEEVMKLRPKILNSVGTSDSKRIGGITKENENSED
jgi:hypothetical protein